MILNRTECGAFGITPASFGRYKGKADLHLHSRYSTISSYQPELLVRGAEALGLHTIALTDHLNMYGSRIAQSIAKEQGFNVRVLSGMEIMSPGGLIPQDRLMERLREVYPTGEEAKNVAKDRRYHDTHILGYSFDPNNPNIIDVEKRMIDRKIEIMVTALRIVNEALRKRKVLQRELSVADLELEEGIAPNRKYLFRIVETNGYGDLLDRHYLDNVIEEARQECGGYLSLSIEEANRLIHSAGGLTFLAHPLIGNVVKFAMGLYSEKSHQVRWDRMIAEFPQHIDFFEELIDVLVSRFKDLGGDGVEVIHSDHIYMAGMIKKIEEAASRYDMKMSGGSDFHVAKGKKYYGLTMPVYLGIAPLERVDEKRATFDVAKMSDWA